MPPQLLAATLQNAVTAIPPADGGLEISGQIGPARVGVGADGAPPGVAASQGWGGHPARVAGALLQWSLLQDTAHPLCTRQTGTCCVSPSSY